MEFLGDVEEEDFLESLTEEEIKQGMRHAEETHKQRMKHREELHVQHKKHHEEAHKQNMTIARTTGLFYSPAPCVHPVAPAGATDTNTPSLTPPSP